MLDFRNGRYDPGGIRWSSALTAAKARCPRTLSAAVPAPRCYEARNLLDFSVVVQQMNVSSDSCWINLTHSITHEFTLARRLEYNGVAKRALGLIEATTLAARTQAPNVCIGG